MVTRDENERLAVVETALGEVKADVSEIKVDVKALLAANAGGMAIRGLIRNFVPFAALGVSIAALLARGG